MHFHEPSRETWEGYFAGTKAACAGGVTTVFDMPVMGIPYAFDGSSLSSKVKASLDRLWTDCGFLGAVQSGNLSKIKGLIDKGVFGIYANYGNPEYYAAEPITAEEFVNVQTMLKGTKIPLMVSCQKCSDPLRLKARSPFRDQLPENRAIATVEYSPDKGEEEFKASPSSKSMDLPIYLPPVQMPPHAIFWSLISVLQ